MDKTASTSTARWPDTPAIFGFLSLTEQGEWRLHPDGAAWHAHQTPSNTNTHDNPTPKGELISSTQIRRFIDQHYSHDAHGQWFFQNGPQRVYVRLDAAPYILRTTGPNFELQTHNGLKVLHIHSWWLDDVGKLYAITEHGPGLIAGRDLIEVLDNLYTTAGQSLISALEDKTVSTHDGTIEVSTIAHQQAQSKDTRSKPFKLNDQITPLTFCTVSDIPRLLGFVRQPKRLES